MNSQNHPRAVRRPSSAKADDTVHSDSPQAASSEQPRSGEAEAASRPRPVTRGAASATRPAGQSDLKNNLQSQTPLNRRMRQKKTAPADPGTVRRATKPQYFRIKEDEEPKRGHPIIGRIFLVAVLYAVLMLLSILLFSIMLPRHDTGETDNYVYQLGPDGNYYSRKTYAWSTVRSGDAYYVNMTDLAAYCDLATTGDDKSMRYIVKDTGETVEFVLDQSVAYVNGIQERIGSSVYVRGGNVYVPLDFVSRCFYGLDTDIDLEKNKITVALQTDEEGVAVGISFPYKPAASSSSIRFADLDTDLQVQILIQNQPQVPEDGNDPQNGTAQPEA